LSSKHNIFAKFGLNERQSEQFLSLFQNEVSLKKGEFWLREGEVCQHLGIITEGMCRHFFTNENADEITRWVSLESDFVTSLGSFVRGSESNENIQAISPTKIMVVDKAAWNAFYRENEFARQLWTVALEDYLIGLEERLFSQISQKAQDRFAFLQQNYPRMVRQVPNKYLASILGVNPRHLSRLKLG